MSTSLVDKFHGGTIASSSTRSKTGRRASGTSERPSKTAGAGRCSNSRSRRPLTGAWVPLNAHQKRTLLCSRKLIHHQSQFLRAPTVLFASERGQGRAAFFSARRSKPLTLRSGEYAGEWLCAQQFRAHNHDDKALIPTSQVGQVYERKVGQFLRASRGCRANQVRSCAAVATASARCMAKPFFAPRSMPAGRPWEACRVDFWGMENSPGRCRKPGMRSPTALPSLNRAAAWWTIPDQVTRRKP